MNATVFLGGGRITSALVAGLCRGRYRCSIVVHDRHPEKLKELERHHRVHVEADLQRALSDARIAILAVRPDSVPDLLKQMRGLDRPLTLVSLAAGVRLAQLRRMLGRPAHWVRAMPSPVCRTRRGLTAVVFDRGVPRDIRFEVLLLFGLVGRVIEIPERKFDAFTVTYSSSHGYHALWALASAARKLGLDRKTALIAASHALADGILAWREGSLSLPRLLHEAATPGGIAATVMAASDKAGYQRAIERGLRAGLARARKNARM
jgi:pyrroline-5-carboxylate reductase